MVVIGDHGTSADWCLLLKSMWRFVKGLIILANTVVNGEQNFIFVTGDEP